MNPINKLLNSRFFALIVKEINQIFANKSIIFLLLFPPTIQLLIYGFALNPDVHNLKLGVVDYAQTYTSRELIDNFTKNNIFILDKNLINEQKLSEQVRDGKLTLGVIIPPDFQRKLAADKTAEIQVFIDGVDANTAGIANGYINQIVNQFNSQLDSQDFSPLIQTQTRFLYNPGLISSWFFVPGMIGVVLTLISSLVSCSTVVREKDSGTLEQLLMTPAEAWEILLAKIVPLFTLLMGDVFLALGIAKLVFGVPFRGSLPLFLMLSGLYVFVGMGVGIMLATISRTQQQAILTSFFINLPLIQLSGAIAPIESMPKFLQYLSLLNPLRHYVKILRFIILKGVGLDVLWPHAVALCGFAIIILSISISRFRRQLA